MKQLSRPWTNLVAHATTNVALSEEGSFDFGICHHEIYKSLIWDNHYNYYSDNIQHANYLIRVIIMLSYISELLLKACYELLLIVPRKSHSHHE